MEIIALKSSVIRRKLEGFNFATIYLEQNIQRRQVRFLFFVLHLQHYRECGRTRRVSLIILFLTKKCNYMELSTIHSFGVFQRYFQKYQESFLHFALQIIFVVFDKKHPSLKLDLKRKTAFNFSISECQNPGILIDFNYSRVWIGYIVTCNYKCVTVSVI